MTIETKYNIGQEVFFMYDLQPTSGEIVMIDIERYAHMQFTKYTVVLCDVFISFYEEKIFPTKEELLKSL